MSVLFESQNQYASSAVLEKDHKREGAEGIGKTASPSVNARAEYSRSASLSG